MPYVMNDAKTSGTSIHITAPKVTPAKPADNGGQDEAHADDKGAVPAVLPPDDLVLVQVTDIGDTRLAAGLDEHPADVGPPEAIVGIVWIEGRVGVAVVRAVAARPPLD